MKWCSFFHFVLACSCFLTIYSVRTPSISFDKSLPSQGRQGYEHSAILLRREAGQCLSNCAGAPPRASSSTSNNDRLGADQHRNPAPIDNQNQHRSREKSPVRIPTRSGSPGPSRGVKPNLSKGSSCINPDGSYTQIDITAQGPCRVDIVRGRFVGQIAPPESRITHEVAPGQVLRKMTMHPNMITARIETNMAKGDKPGGEINAQAIGQHVYAHTKIGHPGPGNYDATLESVRQGARTIHAWGSATGRKTSDLLPGPMPTYAAGASAALPGTRAGITLSSRAGVSLVIASNWPSDELLGQAGLRRKPLNGPMWNEYTAVRPPRKDIPAPEKIAPWPRRDQLRQ